MPQPESSRRAAYAARRAAGMCVSCSQPAAPGMALCLACQYDHGQSLKRTQARKLRERECLACSASAAPGDRFCAFHREQRREAGRARQKRVYEERKARGECPLCGNPSYPGNVLCAVHLLKVRKGRKY